jgi:hypothetical protein
VRGDHKTIVVRACVEPHNCACVRGAAQLCGWRHFFTLGSAALGTPVCPTTTVSAATTLQRTEQRGAAALRGEPSWRRSCWRRVLPSYNRYKERICIHL